MTTNRTTLRTTAPFLMPSGGWVWVTWTNSIPNKHAAILEKKEELGAVAADFGQADHDFVR
jgi:hypothetical protein